MNKHVGKSARSIGLQILFVLILVTGALTVCDGISSLIHGGWYSADLWFLGFCLLTGLIYVSVKLVKKHRDVVDTE